ncbi:MAG: PHP domain-containing protein [Spirochaetales bacterium]|jgi:3',5'-nucleoside bisphosphate phosphatase|nr:PHP domain-containing protein [Spirochaetales bacterium]
MFSTLRVDLHTHTCLSPCGDARMIPENILEAAARRKIDVLGITDHNSAENVTAVTKAAADYGITIIGGMELTTEEEVHILCLFDGKEALSDFQELVYGRLHGSNSPEDFGHQWVVDFEGGVLDVNPRLLFGATTLEIHEAVKAVHERDGMAIAAHVDRAAFSIVSQLGFIPSDLDLDGAELSPFSDQTGFDTGNLTIPIVSFSDAHYVEEIGRQCTEIAAADASFAEIKMALRAEGGRQIKGR